MLFRSPTSRTNGVDMASGEHGGVVGATPGADHVANAVDRDVETEIDHPGAHEIAPVTVVVGEGQTARPASRYGGDRSQGVDPGTQTVGIDAHPSGDGSDLR